jgi:hypothetical protein
VEDPIRSRCAKRLASGFWKNSYTGSLQYTWEVWWVSDRYNEEEDQRWVLMVGVPPDMRRSCVIWKLDEALVVRMESESDDRLSVPLEAQIALIHAAREGFKG